MLADPVLCGRCLPGLQRPALWLCPHMAGDRALVSSPSSQDTKTSWGLKGHDLKPHLVIPLHWESGLPRTDFGGVCLLSHSATSDSL